MALDADTEEHLLRDVQRKGLPLGQVSFVDVCDADPAICGRSGQPACRPVQQHWGKIKKLTPRDRLALIKRHKTPRSPATLAAVEEDKGEPTQTIDEEEEESIIDEEEEESIIDEDEDEDEESIIDDIASTFTSLLHYASWEDSRYSKGERTMKVKVKSDLY
jgi:hypothetical protein